MEFVDHREGREAKVSHANQTEGGKSVSQSSQEIRATWNLLKLHILLASNLDLLNLKFHGRVLIIFMFNKCPRWVCLEDLLKDTWVKEWPTLRVPRVLGGQAASALPGGWLELHISFLT